MVLRSYFILLVLNSTHAPVTKWSMDVLFSVYISYSTVHVAGNSYMYVLVLNLYLHQSDLFVLYICGIFMGKLICIHPFYNKLCLKLKSDTYFDV